MVKADANAIKPERNRNDETPIDIPDDTARRRRASPT
jgi:hypothetical protein